MASIIFAVHMELFASFFSAVIARVVCRYMIEWLHPFKF